MRTIDPSLRIPLRFELASEQREGCECYTILYGRVEASQIHREARRRQGWKVRSRLFLRSSAFLSYRYGRLADKKRDRSTPKGDRDREKFGLGTLQGWGDIGFAIHSFAERARKTLREPIEPVEERLPQDRYTHKERTSEVGDPRWRMKRLRKPKRRESAVC